RPPSDACPNPSIRHADADRVLCAGSTTLPPGPRVRATVLADRCQLRSSSVMTPHHALASATLAQLYASQGHLDKALAQVDELLTRKPGDGDALALRERLYLRKGARLELRVDREILLRWQV